MQSGDRQYNRCSVIYTRAMHKLELICRSPPRRTRKPALVFVHGAYVGAWCWDVHFLAYFARSGYASYALSLRGHGASGCDGAYSAQGLDAYVEDVESVLARIDEPLVLIGHSMGGLVVSRCLARPHAAYRERLRAGVLMAPVPRTGLVPAVMGLALRSPLLLAELNQIQFGRSRPRALTHVRRALFSADLDEAIVRSYFVRMQPESQQAILEMSMLHFLWPDPAPAVPLLVLGAQDDGFFAPELVCADARKLGAPCEIFPDIAHAMMLERRWQRVADHIADWAAAL
jgi:pimeloyl-ACP methyl ester carboxylesterase